MPSSYFQPSQAQGRAFFGDPPGGPVVMLNLLRFRELADYSATPDLAPPKPVTGEEAYRLYAQHVMPLLAEAGSEVIFQGTSAGWLIGPGTEGEGGERWDMALLVRHVSAARFLAFASDQTYLAIAGHRTAALEDSRLLPIRPTT